MNKIKTGRHPGESTTNMLWGDDRHTHIRIASRMWATAPGVKKEGSHGQLWIKDQMCIKSSYRRFTG